MREIRHQVDFCVVGGGLAGMLAAIAAARHGAKVVLMQDRPVLGGNASSEVRRWVCGAHGKNNRETGILEEILLENHYRNATANFQIWDSVLYEKARFEPNITLLLNCSCNAAVMEGNRIRSIRGWQGTAETWHVVEAGLFADCSGDSVLAPLTGAEFRVGREAAGEFNEDIEPPEADRKTMGMSCLIRSARWSVGAVQHWAHKYLTARSCPPRPQILSTNYWWIGGRRARLDPRHGAAAR